MQDLVSTGELEHARRSSLPRELNAMARMLAVWMVLALPAIQSADAHPFTATDLARLERLSDPRISPDGRFVAYNVRSTEWEANRGVNAVWVLERTAADNVPRLIRD